MIEVRGWATFTCDKCKASYVRKTRLSKVEADTDRPITYDDVRLVLPKGWRLVFEKGDLARTLCQKCAKEKNDG